MGPWTTSEGEKHSISCCQETHTKSVGQSGRGRACGETVENTEWPCGAGTGQARARPAAERENRHLLWQAGTGTLPRSCLSVSSGPSCHGCHHPFFFVLPSAAPEPTTPSSWLGSTQTACLVTGITQVPAYLLHKRKGRPGLSVCTCVRARRPPCQEPLEEGVKIKRTT